jgi:MFS family permease
MNKLSLHCAENYQIGLFGSLELFGYMAGCLLFVPLADTYGRKKFLIVIFIVYFYNFFTLFFVTSLNVIYPTFAIAGMSHSIRAFVVYVLMIELVPGKEALVTGIIFFLDGLSCIYCPLIFLYITKQT